MRAILLAAGIGARLGPVTLERPKILLELGGRTLLDRHVENLLAIGASEIALVIGHLAEQVEAEIARLRRTYGATIVTTVNPAYREGSALSAAAAEPWIDGSAPVLLMDGDVLYPAVLLERLVASPHATCLLIDRDCALDEDDPVLVPIRAGRPVDFCKRYGGDFAAIGESVGFFKLGVGDQPRWREAARARTAPYRRRETLEDIVQELVREGRFGHEDVSGLPWIEIDYPDDLVRAESEILPAIERTQSPRG